MPRSDLGLAEDSTIGFKIDNPLLSRSEMMRSKICAHKQDFEGHVN